MHSIQYDINAKSINTAAKHGGLSNHSYKQHSHHSVTFTSFMSWVPDGRGETEVVIGKGLTSGEEAIMGHEPPSNICTQNPTSDANTALFFDRKHYIRCIYGIPHNTGRMCLFFREFHEMDMLICLCVYLHISKGFNTWTAMVLIPVITHSCYSNVLNRFTSSSSSLTFIYRTVINGERNWLPVTDFYLNGVIFNLFDFKGFHKIRLKTEHLLQWSW